MSQLRSHIREDVFDMATLAANPWFREDWAERIREQNRLPTRQLKLAALATARFGGSRACRAVIDVAYRRAGEEVVDLGYHSIVLRRGTMVQKVHYRHSGGSAAQHAEVARLTEQQDIVLDWFAHHAVAQHFRVGSSPLHPDRTYVVADQRYIGNARPIDVRRPDEETLAFLHSASYMLEQTGYIPDIVGLGNLLATPEGPRLVDTIPLSRSDPADRHAFQHAAAILATHGLRSHVTVGD